MSARKASTPERILAAYEVAEEITERELGDELVNMVWTDELVHEVRRRVVERLGHAGLPVEVRLTSNDLRLGQVHQWLASPDKFSPFVDEVAVRRALAFDWSAIARLTDAERTMFYDALAIHPDPWQLGGDALRNGNFPADPGHPRRMAFERGPDDARAAVIQRVKYRRDGGVLAAA